MRTTEGEGDKLEMPSDDEEITIPSQDSADIPNVDICDEQSENTQRSRRLATTYGAQAWGSPATDWCGAPSSHGRFSIQECGGGFAVRHPNGTLRLSPERRIFMEEEVFTPPRGAVRSLSLRVCKVRHELCLRLFRRTL